MVECQRQSVQANSPGHRHLYQLRRYRRIDIAVRNERVRQVIALEGIMSCARQV